MTNYDFPKVNKDHITSRFTPNGLYQGPRNAFQTCPRLCVYWAFSSLILIPPPGCDLCSLKDFFMSCMSFYLKVYTTWDWCLISSFSVGCLHHVITPSTFKKPHLLTKIQLAQQAQKSLLHLISCLKCIGPINFCCRPDVIMNQAKNKRFGWFWCSPFQLSRWSERIVIFHWKVSTITS